MFYSCTMYQVNSSEMTIIINLIYIVDQMVYLDANSVSSNCKVLIPHYAIIGYDRLVDNLMGFFGQDRMVLPCRDFCFEFLQSCSNILPGELKDRIKCSALATEADGPGACISKPG